MLCDGNPIASFDTEPWGSDNAAWEAAWRYLYDPITGLIAQSDTREVAPEPSIDIAPTTRRDANASKALPAVIDIYRSDRLVGGEDRTQMFARKAYEIADAMERERKVTS